MAAEVLDPRFETVTPRERLWREFAARAATGTTGTGSIGTTGSPSAWRARTWLWASLMLPGGDDDAVVALLVREWAAYRAAHPDEPDIAFRPPGTAPDDEAVVPGPPPYDALPPLRHGRYGADLPTHDERVREEQERLARRDQAFYGF